MICIGLQVDEVGLLGGPGPELRAVHGTRVMANRLDKGIVNKETHDQTCCIIILRKSRP